VRDVFVAGRVPEHSRDQGSWTALRRVLAPGGVVAVNVADSAPLELARADAALALRTFTSAVAIADPAVFKGRRYGNVIVAGSNAPLDEVAIARRVHGLPMPARVMAGAELRRFAGF